MGDKEPRIIIIEDDFVLGEQLAVFFSKGYGVSLAILKKESPSLRNRSLTWLLPIFFFPAGKAGLISSVS